MAGIGTLTCTGKGWRVGDGFCQLLTQLAEWLGLIQDCTKESGRTEAVETTRIIRPLGVAEVE